MGWLWYDGVLFYHQFSQKERYSFHQSSNIIELWSVDLWRLWYAIKENNYAVTGTDNTVETRPTIHSTVNDTVDSTAME